MKFFHHRKVTGAVEFRSNFFLAHALSEELHLLLGLARFHELWADVSLQRDRQRGVCSRWYYIISRAAGYSLIISWEYCAARCRGVCSSLITWLRIQDLLFFYRLIRAMFESFLIATRWPGVMLLSFLHSCLLRITEATFCHLFPSSYQKKLFKYFIGTFLSQNDDLLSCWFY